VLLYLSDALTTEVLLVLLVITNGTGVIQEFYLHTALLPSREEISIIVCIQSGKSGIKYDVFL